MLQGMKKLLAVGIVGTMLAVPAQAMAQSPTKDGYSDSSVAVVNSDERGGSGHSSSWSGDSLPFSGLDVALIVAMGGGLVLLGFGMRRLTRRPDPA